MPDENPDSVTAGGGNFVVEGRATWASKDGQLWVRVRSSHFSSWNSPILWSGEEFLAYGSSVVYSSVDGV